MLLPIALPPQKTALHVAVLPEQQPRSRVHNQPCKILCEHTARGSLSPSELNVPLPALDTSHRKITGVLTSRWHRTIPLLGRPPLSEDKPLPGKSSLIKYEPNADTGTDAPASSKWKVGRGKKQFPQNSSWKELKTIGAAVAQQTQHTQSQHCLTCSNCKPPL